MRLPNFLIIGAAKSGTTSLAAYLEQHSEVFFCPEKEPNYFALAGESLPHAGPASPETLYELIYAYSVTDYQEYLSLFEGVGGQKAIGEASVRYLYYPEAPRRIRSEIPDVRLVAILREPVSRLYSHYCMNVQYQLEPLSLPDAIAEEKARAEANWGWDWHYVNMSLYSKQLKRYFDLFDRGQIKVFLYDDFVNEPLAVYQEICRHIGVDDRFIPDMSYRGKAAYRPRNLVIDRWLHWPRAAKTGLERYIPCRLPKKLFSRLERWNSVPVPRLDDKLRQRLTELFRDDVRELEELLGRRIPWYA
jgi:hypothetical protein